MDNRERNQTNVQDAAKYTNMSNNSLTVNGRLLAIEKAEFAYSIFTTK